MNENFNWTKDSGGLQEVTNDVLVCKDCTWATEETGRCQVYKELKPGAVLYGGKCKYYEKE